MRPMTEEAFIAILNEYENNIKAMNKSDFDLNIFTQFMDNECYLYTIRATNNKD